VSAILLQLGTLSILITLAFPERPKHKTGGRSAICFALNVILVLLVFKIWKKKINRFWLMFRVYRNRIFYDSHEIQIIYENNLTVAQAVLQKLEFRLPPSHWSIYSMLAALMLKNSKTNCAGSFNSTLAV
jgi:hypothetical protein